MFADQQDMEAIIDAGCNVEEVPDKVRRVVESSAIGMSMFHGAWLKVSRHLFHLDIDRRLRDLEHHSFGAADIASFEALMQSQVKQLLQNGHKQFDKFDVQVQLLTHRIIVQVESPSDEWHVRYIALTEGLAINAGQLDMLPWEAQLLQQGDLEHTSSTVRVPDSVLHRISPAREAAQDFLGKQP